MNRTPGQPTSVEAALRVNQVLVFSLIFGVLSFAMVVVFLRTGRHNTPSGGTDANLFLGLMGALFIGTTIAGVVIRSMTVGGLRKRSDAGEQMSDLSLVSKFSSLTILRAALAEGPALFGVVITLITDSWLGLAGAGFGMVLLAMVFPSRGKFESFVRDATGRMP